MPSVVIPVVVAPFKSAIRFSTAARVKLALRVRFTSQDYNSKNGKLTSSRVAHCDLGEVPVANVIKLFYGRKLRLFIISYIVFVPSKPFQPSLMFAGKARSLP